MGLPPEDFVGRGRRRRGSMGENTGPLLLCRMYRFFLRRSLQDITVPLPLWYNLAGG